MDPRYHPGAVDISIRFAIETCTLGLALVAITDQGVCAVFLGSDGAALEADLRRRFPKAQITQADARFVDHLTQVIAAIDQPRAARKPPLDVQGTVFQQKVWRALTTIPAGNTATYAQVAMAIGAPKSVRAVAQACGANPVAVLVPCHRVLRSDGGLSGYRWGTNRKRKLLAAEGVLVYLTDASNAHKAAGAST